MKKLAFSDKTQTVFFFNLIFEETILATDVEKSLKVFVIEIGSLLCFLCIFVFHDTKVLLPAQVF